MASDSVPTRRRVAAVRLPFMSAHGACRIYDATGQQIATVNISTRERRDMAGRLVGVMAADEAQPAREGIDVVFAGRVNSTFSNDPTEIAERKAEVRERARRLAQEDAA